MFFYKKYLVLIKYNLKKDKKKKKANIITVIFNYKNLLFEYPNKIYIKFI